MSTLTNQTAQPKEANNNYNCLPFTHKWSKWSEVIEDYSGSQRQVRYCQHCGMITWRQSVWVMLAQLQASQINSVVDKLKGSK